MHISWPHSWFLNFKKCSLFSRRWHFSQYRYVIARPPTFSEVYASDQVFCLVPFNVSANDLLAVISSIPYKRRKSTSKTKPFSWSRSQILCTIKELILCIACSGCFFVNILCLASPKLNTFLPPRFFSFFALLIYCQQHHRHFILSVFAENCDPHSDHLFPQLLWLFLPTPLLHLRSPALCSQNHPSLLLLQPPYCCSSSAD